MRPIAPPVPYGDDAIFVEVTRTQDAARRFPLECGRKVKVGVRNIHVLAHPGLSFLILTDGSEAGSVHQVFVVPRGVLYIIYVHERLVDVRGEARRRRTRVVSNLVGWRSAAERAPALRALGIREGRGYRLEVVSLGLPRSAHPRRR